MDSNGYNPSIIPNHSETECWLCGGNGRGKMDRHEVFGGAYRQKSKAWGLWVNLCHEPCHMTSLHREHIDDTLLRKTAQIAAERVYGLSREDFIKEYGKNYL